MHTNTTLQDYRLAEHERQYKQACLSESKWRAAVFGALCFALSSALTGWYAFQSGYPASAVTGAFTAAVHGMLLVMVAGGIASFVAKQRKDALRRDVALLNMDAHAWSQRVEASLAAEKARIRTNGWVWTAVAVLVNVLFTVIVVSGW